MDLQQFYSECQKIDARLKQIRQESEFQDTDNRKWVFGVLRSQMIHYEIMLHILHARYNQTIQPPDAFQEIIGIGYTEQAQWEEFQVTAKIAYITLSHFVIENFFKTLLAELETSKDPPTGFYVITKTLLDKITISDKQRKLEVLNAMAMVRNSMHNNGIHAPIPPAPPSQTVTIGATTLNFDKGEEGSILESEMVDLINAVIDILDEIVQAPEIQNLTSVPLLFIPKF